MANNENLIPPVKGERRNPNGRPKGSISMKTRIAKILESNTNESIIKQFKGLNLPKSSKKNVDALIGAMLIKGLQGDVPAAKLLFEYYAGKPEQPISGVEDKPIEITFKRIE